MNGQGRILHRASTLVEVAISASILIMAAISAASMTVMTMPRFEPAPKVAVRSLLICFGTPSSSSLKTRVCDMRYGWPLH